MARTWPSAGVMTGMMATLLVAGGVVAAPFLSASDQAAAGGQSPQASPGEVYRKVLDVGWVAAGRAPAGASPLPLPAAVVAAPSHENAVEFDVPEGAAAIHVEGTWDCIGDCLATMVLAPGGLRTLSGGGQDMRDQAEGDGGGQVHVAHPQPGRWHFSLVPAGASADGSGQMTIVVYG